MYNVNNKDKNLAALFGEASSKITEKFRVTTVALSGNNSNRITLMKVMYTYLSNPIDQCFKCHLI